MTLYTSHFKGHNIQTNGKVKHSFEKILNIYYHKNTHLHLNKTLFVSQAKEKKISFTT